MRYATPAVCLSLAVGFLVGCSANSQPSQNSAIPTDRSRSHELRYPAAFSVTPEDTPLPQPPIGPRARGWLSPEARKAQSVGAVVYATDKFSSAIFIYPEARFNHSPIGMITSGVVNPWALYVDKNGNLYVANQNGGGGSGSVTVYPPGSVYPTATYTEALSRPLYPIVDQYGNLFVGNAGNGTVVEYLAGSTSAYQVLQTPGQEVDGMDFDQQGDLYVSYRSQHANGSIEEFAPGSSEGQVLGMTIYQPQGVAVDIQGNLLISQSVADNVVLYRPGATTPAGSSALPGGSGNSSQLVITKSEKQAFVSTEGGYIYVTTYPGSKNTIWTQQNHGLGSLEGIALSNGQAF